MNPHTLFYFAGRCLTLDEHPALRDSVSEGFSSGRIPAGDFILYCDAQLVLPAVYMKLKRHDLTDAFKPELIEHLEHVCSLNRRRNVAILEQVEEISAALAQGGIQPVYLKGVAHLLDGLYGDSGERLIGDLDILVDEGVSSGASELIRGLDYEFRWRYGRVPEWMPEHHFYPLVRKGENEQVAVELHWKPTPERYCGNFQTAMVLSRKVSVEGRENCYVPCDSDKIAHNVIHSQLTNGCYRFKSTPLRDIYDLYLISGRASLKASFSRLKEGDRDKASGYFLFSASALGLGQTFYDSGSKRAKRHCLMCDQALKHPRIFIFYRVYATLDEFFSRYLVRLIKATFNKPLRKYIFMRLKDPFWYRAQLDKLRAKIFR